MSEKQQEIKVTVPPQGDFKTSLGTCLQGYLPEGTTYSAVVAVFGKPNAPASDDGKVKVEWIGKIDQGLGDMIFTIYDYHSDVPPRKNLEWHIGGKQREVVELVRTYFERTIITRQAEKKEADIQERIDMIEEAREHLGFATDALNECDRMLRQKKDEG